jgi:hypothetical protein
METRGRRRRSQHPAHLLTSAQAEKTADFPVLIPPALSIPWDDAPWAGMCPIARLTGTVMKNGSVENALRWMLAASMLLATSVTSSTFVHGHSGGNVAHQHGSSDHTLPHSLALTAYHDGHDSDMSVSAVDVHRHGCLTLLGAVTYMPTPNEPGGSHGQSSCAWKTIVAVSAAQGVRAFSKVAAIDCLGLASCASVSIGCVCESKQPSSLRAGTAPASPLCDRARHERSGVQRA